MKKVFERHPQNRAKRNRFSYYLYLTQIESLNIIQTRTHLNVHGYIEFYDDV